MTFDHLGLSADILRAVAEEGYTEPTPIQEEAIPLVLAGRDLLAAAQTGTGKTAAFTLPILERLKVHANTSFSPARHPVRALMVTPTRELAMQIAESVAAYGRHVPLRSAVVYGGIPIDPQIKELRSGIEILVATPGRLMDHVGQRTVNLTQVEILVLDEADRMLDMGFIPDIRKIVALLPAKRQNLLFSATFSEEIRRLAQEFLNDPATVEVAARNTAAEGVEQVLYPVDRDRKEDLLIHLIRRDKMEQVLVFTRTKLAASRLASYLDRRGVAAIAIHSDRSQPERTRALEDFKRGEVTCLVATDVASRGPRYRGAPLRRQLRASLRAAGLHPSDRPDRTSRIDRHRDLPGHGRRGRAAQGRPAPAQARDPVPRRGGLRARSDGRAATDPRVRQPRRGSRGRRAAPPRSPQADPDADGEPAGLRTVGSTNGR